VIVWELLGEGIFNSCALRPALQQSTTASANNNFFMNFYVFCFSLLIKVDKDNLIKNSKPSIGKKMRNVCFLMLFVCLGLGTVRAQDYKFSSIDKSPADIVYYPTNVVKEKDPAKTPIVRVVYSRPSKNGRPIFGVLEQFGKVWRTGANESTEIKFYQDVKMGGKNIKAGTYSLFTIPEKDNWTIIINRQTDKWGAYTYDQSKDVARIKVPVKTHPTVIEAFSITFSDAASGANMVLGWDQTVVEVPFTLSKK
jgi:hypothetical protein